MTEIAFAAGFGSIRRFNGTFRALFGRAPCTLRRASPRGTTDGSGAAVSLLLRYQPPYDWPGVLEFLRLRAIAGIERVEENCYTRTIQLEGRQGVVSVRPAEGNALRASVRFPRLSALPVSSRVCAASSTWRRSLAISAHLAKDPPGAAGRDAPESLRVSTTQL